MGSLEANLYVLVTFKVHRLDQLALVVEHRNEGGAIVGK
jgi:hypothetical protein